VIDNESHTLVEVWDVKTFRLTVGKARAEETLVKAMDYSLSTLVRRLTKGQDIGGDKNPYIHPRFWDKPDSVQAEVQHMAFVSAVRAQVRFGVRRPGKDIQNGVVPVEANTDRDFSDLCDFLRLHTDQLGHVDGDKAGGRYVTHISWFNFQFGLHLSDKDKVEYICENTEGNQTRIMRESFGRICATLTDVCKRQTAVGFERLNSAYEVMSEKQEKLVFPSMYLLAKTLKPVPNAKTRAVRAAFCTSNTGVSRFLSDYFREARHELELLMKQQYGYEIEVLESCDDMGVFLEELRACDTEFECLVIADFAALYPNEDIDKEVKPAIRLALEWLQKPEQEINDVFILMDASQNEGYVAVDRGTHKGIWRLKNQYIIGDPESPEGSNLQLYVRRILQLKQGAPTHWRRLIDDIFFAIPVGKRMPVGALDKWLQSSYRGLLKPQGHHEFEVKMGQEVDVFDYTVYIDPFGKLQYRPNLKLEHKSYVPLESNHPLHIYRGVAYGEAWRLLKRSSSRAAYDSAMLELHKKLAQAHFPDDAIAVARRLSFDKHRKSAVEQMIRTHGKRYQTDVRSKTVDRLLIPLLYDRSVDLEPILRDVIQSSIDLLPKADREYVRSHMIGFKLQPKAMNRLGIKDT
jgi:hypothetical protein